MHKNRVLHARITDDTHDKLTKKCDELGCSITDYVVSVLDSSFDEEPSDIEPEPKPTIEVIPELRNVRVIND